MAVSTKIDSSLRLAFEDSVDPVTGTLTLKNKTFNNIKISATPDQLFAVTQALVPLQQRTLYSIKRNDDSLITEN